MKCKSCNGVGSIRCKECHGEGIKYGVKKCDKCLGDGNVACATCSGTGKVGFFSRFKTGS